MVHIPSDVYALSIMDLVPAAISTLLLFRFLSSFQPCPSMQIDIDDFTTTNDSVFLFFFLRFFNQVTSLHSRSYLGDISQFEQSSFESTRLLVQVFTKRSHDYSGR